LESIVLSVFVVMVDWRQRFMKAGARYEVVKTLEGLSDISLVAAVPASLDGRVSVPWSLKKRWR
jgi:hypothetical protein